MATKNSTAIEKNNDPNFNSGDNAAITAFWICGWRALEYRRGDAAAIIDPYAERLMSNGGWSHFEKQGTKLSKLLNLGNLRNTVINRTKFYDSNIMKGVKNFGIRQTIIIGAGLDTRAFRLFQDYPDMHVIEIDHPNLFAYKEPRLEGLKPSCKRSILSLDYDEVTEWDVRAREKFGFDPLKPTIFVLEGVTMYIPLENELELYRKIDANAALNSVITGCSQHVFNSPRDVGYGITWYNTDRKAMKEVLKYWGVSLTATNPFGIGVAMTMMGIKRDKPYESDSHFLSKIFPFIRFELRESSP